MKLTVCKVSLFNLDGKILIFLNVFKNELRDLVQFKEFFMRIFVGIMLIKILFGLTSTIYLSDYQFIYLIINKLYNKLNLN